jgi:hypothetical protein
MNPDLHAEKFAQILGEEIQLYKDGELRQHLQDQIKIYGSRWSWDSRINDWIKFLDEFAGKKAKTNSAKVNEYDTVKYTDYIKELNRTQIAREDFESVLSNKHKFRVIYTDKDTYLTKDPNFVPVDDETSINLFEGM